MEKLVSMKHDVFYNTKELTRPEQKALLRKAHSLCDHWWFDKLDCSISFARERIKDIAFDEAMEHFVERAVMNVVERNETFAAETCLEVGFRSMEIPVDYFLWIIVPLKHANYITTDLRVRS